jgi:hypothetical protein
MSKISYDLARIPDNIRSFPLIVFSALFQGGGKCTRVTAFYNTGGNTKKLLERGKEK